MKIPLRKWIIFILLALLALGIWYKLEYPRLSFVNLSVNKEEAIAKACSYLVYLGVNPKDYITAATFYTDDWSDRYLQKTLGGKAEKFIQEHDFQLFAWQVRFFKDNQKQEYVLRLSAQSGQILAFTHFIEDTEPRITPDEANARQQAEKFLKEHYGLRLQEYEFHEKQIKRFDQRTDYIFSWEKKW